MCAEPRACGSPCEQGRGQSRAVPRYVSTDGVDLTLRGVVRREPRVPLPPSHCSHDMTQEDGKGHLIAGRGAIWGPTFGCKVSLGLTVCICRMRPRPF